MVFTPPPASFASASSPNSRPHLGELLVRFGRLSQRDLEHALAAQAEISDLLGRVLVRQGILTEADVVRALSAQLGIKVAGSDDFPEAPLQVPGIESDYLLAHFALPLKIEDGTLYVAMATPQDESTVKALRLATGLWVRPRVAVESDLRAALERLYAQGDAAGKDGDSPSAPGLAGGSDSIERAGEEPAIHFVEQVITKALESEASGIHLEPFSDGLRVRCRVDGLLRETGRAGAELAAAVVARIKSMASLDVAECRLPQDGRIVDRLQGREFELRVSTLPTIHGESVTMHVSGCARSLPGLEDMGFSPDTLARYRGLLGRSRGLVLVAGPAGSGKTATLHASLAKLDAGALKIFTIEDPVEYRLDGVGQVQVEPQAGMGFADALRAILRQAPDVIMTGELRDAETARIAVQAALSGHLVLSAMHADTAAGVIVRLLDMGIEPYLVASALDCVLSQRLVRRLCPHCRKSVALAPGVMEETGLARFMPPGVDTVFAAGGCTACGHTGYLGRAAIHELSILDEAVRRAIVRGADTAGLQAAARRDGLPTLREDGLRKVAAGITSLEEALRVTQGPEV